MVGVYSGAQGELVSPHEAIEAFQQEIELIRPYQTYNLPDLTDDINHNGMYVRPSVRLAAGIFLDRSVTGGSEGAPSKPDALTFMVQPGNRLGREDSHNQVFFGRLQLTNFSQITDKQVQVAVKPTKNKSALLGELAMFQLLHKLNLPTFEPTGLLVSANAPQDYLLTAFKGPVNTLDTIEWSELDIDEQWALCGIGVETAALLNSHGLFHNDLEGRNLAVNDLGEKFIVDPELMVSAVEVIETVLITPNAEERSRAVQSIKRMISRELTNICNSIDEYIFKNMPPKSKPRDDLAKFKEYQRHLFRPYKNALKEYGSSYSPVLLEAYDLMIRERKQRAKDNA